MDSCAYFFQRLTAATFLIEVQLKEPKKKKKELNENRDTDRSHAIAKQ